VRGTRGPRVPSWELPAPLPPRPPTSPHPPLQKPRLEPVAAPQPPAAAPQQEATPAGLGAELGVEGQTRPVGKADSLQYSTISEKLPFQQFLLELQTRSGLRDFRI